MKQSKAEVMLHPVRLRIIMTLNGGRKLTAHQLNSLQPDIPHATLYRHLNILVEGGLLTIVEEHQGRGNAERTYALADGHANLTEEDIDHVKKEDLANLISLIMVHLMQEFNAYLERTDDVKQVVGKMSLKQEALYLNPEEIAELVQGWDILVARFRQNQPAINDRMRMLFTRLLVPATENDDAL